MAAELKLRRGTTTEHSAFTGAEGEITVDTDKETVVVHDGSTVGGHALAREDLSNVAEGAIDGSKISGELGEITSLNVGDGKLFVSGTLDRVGVNTDTPQKSLDVVGSFSSEDAVFYGSTSIKIPSGSTSERPSSAENGMFRYNNTSKSAEIFKDSSWHTFALENHKNVKTFGAVGDGVTDDTSAIQSAFDSLSTNDVVYFPPGEYYITSRVNLNGVDNVQFYGYGAVITSDNQPSSLKWEDCDNLFVQGIVFDGKGQINSLFEMINCSNSRVTDCTFKNLAGTFSYGIVHNTTSADAGTKRSGLIVDGCVFDNIGRDGLQTKSVDDLVVTNCLFRNIGQFGTDNHRFSDAIDNGNRVTISNCTFESCTVGAGVLNNFSVIDGCVFSNCGSGVYFGPYDGVISNSRFESCSGEFIQTIRRESGQEILITGNNFSTSTGQSKCFTLFDVDNENRKLFITIQNNLFDGRLGGSSEIHFRRDGGSLRIFNNIFESFIFNLTIDGQSEPDIQINQSMHISVDDNSASGTFTSLINNSDSQGFTRLFVKSEDVSSFDPDFSGKAGFANSSTKSFSTNGSLVNFTNFRPTSSSSGEYSIGPDGSGKFEIFNETGSNKTFKITFER